MSKYVTIGHDTETNQPVTIGDIERRSGLYILGKPGMGKSALIVNLMIQDTKNGHGIFFLDPHEDAIDDLLHRGSYYDIVIYTHLFNPQDETHSFGINLLTCRDINSLRERTETYTRAYNVFYKLWENEWGPWLQLILQNTLWAFIENQEYTLVEVPMFLNPRNVAFRNYILSNITHNPAVVEFWLFEFFQRREREQQERVDAALTRITTLLTHPYIRHIVGQRETTINFDLLMKEPYIWLFKLSANLAPDIKKFIGTILISELLHSVRNRPVDERDQFCIFVDEFQNFTSSDDFKTLITEARKFGVATTIAHQERFGQFADNQKLMGATAAATNKVFFELTVKDAQELAPEFAKAAPPAEKRWEAELAISQEPVSDLLRAGHINHEIREFVYKVLRPAVEQREDIKEDMEYERLIRDELRDMAGIDRIDAQLDTLPMEGKRYFSASENSLRMASSELMASVYQTKKMLLLFARSKGLKETIRALNKFLTAIMEGRVARGQEDFSQFLIGLVHGSALAPEESSKTLALYISLTYGDPKTPREIPCDFARITGIDPEKAALLTREAEEKTNEARRRFREGYLKKKMFWYWINGGKKGVQGREERAIYKKQVDDEATEIIAKNNVYHWDRYVEYADKPGFTGSDMTLYYSPPDLPLRVLNGNEIEALKELCLKKLGQTEQGMLAEVKYYVHIFTLLQQPENHIKVYSGQYVTKTGYVRPVHDMTDEMIQVLINLPRFTAYAKIIQEKGGEQTVWKGPIKTLPLPPRQEPPILEGKRLPEIESLAIENGHDFCKERSQIEEEIRQRQERWRGGVPNEPPPLYE